ncbi:VapC toxin protein [plant metagenome]|uniref:VapC toxin protein n=1 Tax=plant metagenome TaxID=1297885 RepID=A0A484U777_9ZZZZ
MMRYLLDTNILIYLIKHRPPSVAERIAQLALDDALHMSFVSWAELLKGAERSTRADTVRKQLHKLAQHIPVLYETSHDMCLHHARLGAMFKSQGKPIGANDLWIAAHALAEGCVLVTNNTGEFSRVPGLPLQNWVQ